MRPRRGVRFRARLFSDESLAFPKGYGVETMKMVRNWTKTRPCVWWLRSLIVIRDCWPG